MIITVTFNAAIDKSVQVEQFFNNNVNRVINIKQSIGGKGINVSKYLKNHGMESLCTGFLGNDNKSEFIEFMKSRGIPYNFTLVDGITRTNTKILDLSQNTCTELNEIGPSISQARLEEFISKFSGMCNEGDLVVLTGSIPPGIPEDIYAQLTNIAAHKGAEVLLDAEGACLEKGVGALPKIIKVNIKEFAGLTGIKGSCREEVWDAAFRLLKQGIEKIVVTLGEEGLLYFTLEGAYYCNSPQITPVCTVGGGDAVTASLIYCISNNFNACDTIRYCAASGAASVCMESSEEYPMELVYKLQEQTNAVKFG